MFADLLNRRGQAPRQDLGRLHTSEAKSPGIPALAIVVGELEQLFEATNILVLTWSHEGRSYTATRKWE